MGRAWVVQMMPRADQALHLPGVQSRPNTTEGGKSCQLWCEGGSVLGAMGGCKNA
eukprot:CAMPEP_0204515720 /NCGR_PEP_ID=MMETSP0661-20131031/2770_1 /ASSEMBLY_ACC=CAM_ASM_000606 /TAXON_ID=109239 /ORGANISM="Alexandrium margalefi, Strain AMGDE01CS-322" /LENGTH=54 /DNA_ID=CAMNT_0051521049 /DNA_START=112 /DNA_END=276 /DNA_ORIENTATION=+